MLFSDHIIRIHALTDDVVRLGHDSEHASARDSYLIIVNNEDVRISRRQKQKNVNTRTRPEYAAVVNTFFLLLVF